MDDSILFTDFYSTPFFADKIAFVLVFETSTFVSVFGSGLTGFGFITVVVFFSSSCFFVCKAGFTSFFFGTGCYALSSLVVFAGGLAVLGLFFSSTPFYLFSLFFSSSYLPITLFIPVFGIITFGFNTGSFTTGFKDYLTPGFAATSSSPLFLSSFVFVASFV